MALRLSVSYTCHALLHRNIFISVSGTRFCWMLNKRQGLVRPWGLGKLIRLNYLTGSRTRSLPVCSITPQPQRYRLPIYINLYIYIYIFSCWKFSRAAITSLVQRPWEWQKNAFHVHSSETEFVKNTLELFSRNWPQAEIVSQSRNFVDKICIYVVVRTNNLVLRKQNEEIARTRDVSVV
jgi:hypothetical protein